MAHRVEDKDYAALVRRTNEIQRRVDEGSLPLQPAMDALRDIAAGKFRYAELTKLPTYSNIPVFAHSYAYLEQQLIAANVEISHLARSWLRQRKFPQVQTSTPVVRARIWELGFGSRPTTGQLFKRVDELGLTCRDTVAVHAVLAFMPLTVGDRIWFVPSHQNTHQMKMHFFRFEFLEGMESARLATKLIGLQETWEFDDVVVFEQK